MITRICLLIMLAISIATDSPLASDEPTRFKVRSVTVFGNDTFSETRLKNLMLTRPSRFLSPSDFYPEVLDNDVANLVTFYQRNGYLDAQVSIESVEVDSSAAEVHVRLSVVEGEVTTVEGIGIFGNRVLSDSTLLKQCALKQGDAFRRLLVQDAMLSMIRLYADSGYLDAVVKPDVKISQETHKVIVDFEVSENNLAVISGIRIEGLKSTKPNVVKRELLFKQGDVARYSSLIESQRRLYMTGLFEGVFVRPIQDSTGGRGQKQILIDVDENIPHEFTVSLGFASVEKVRGRVELLSNSLAGTGRKAGVAVGASFIRRGVELSFTEPRTLGTRWRTDLNLMYEFLEEPGYDLGRFGARLTLGRSLTRYISTTMSYRYEDAQLRHLKVSDIPSDLDTRVRSLSFTIYRDSRDNLFNTTRGSYLEWTNELAGAFLQGNITFARSVLEIKLFRSLARSTIAGSSINIGWMDFFGESDYIPLSERFYTGGPSSLRGFGYQMVGPLDEDGIPLGGKFKIVWNTAEIRQTVYRMFGAVLFLETGNVWPSISDCRIRDFRTVIGVGARASTPIGIARLDFGINVDRKHDERRSRIFLNIGQAF